jgi:hypothetical protein
MDTALQLDPNFQLIARHPLAAIFVALSSMLSIF